MTNLNRTFWFTLLLLLQVLVFNHIHIMGYATPMPFFYLLLILHSETPRWVYVALAFALGITVDILSNTIGECAAATTFIGLITPNILNVFAPADRGDDGFSPSAQTMKWSGFIKYAMILTIVFCTLFFIMECFSFLHPVDLLIHIGSSTLLTLLIICAMERVRMSVNK